MDSDHPGPRPSAALRGAKILSRRIFRCGFKYQVSARETGAICRLAADDGGGVHDSSGRGSLPPEGEGAIVGLRRLRGGGNRRSGERGYAQTHHADDRGVAAMTTRHRDICRIAGSSVEVSQLGFGAAAIGNLFSVVDDAQARGAMEQAWRDGIRYFDTAPYYGYGLSEPRVGVGRDRFGVRLEALAVRDVLRRSDVRAQEPRLSCVRLESIRGDGGSIARKLYPRGRVKCTFRR